MKISILFTLVLTFAINIFPQTDTNKLNNYKKLAAEIRRKALTEQKGYKLLTELARFGSRLSGSENYYKAVNWAVERMKDAGMDTVWLQECNTPHWIRGNTEKLEMISEGDVNRNFEIAALGNSVGTGDSSIVAQVIEISSFDELEKQKENVRGKIVFYNVYFDIGELNTFKAYGKAVKYRVYGANKAAKYGAVATVVRSVGSKHDNIPHTGSLHYNDTLPKIPAVAIGNLDADYLSTTLSVADSVVLKLQLSAESFDDTLGYNIIGELKGSEMPDEVILIGGHFDSWDKGIGMHDDGGPSIQTIEAIYLLKELGIRPKRTIRCVLFANEENGATGAKKYAAAASEDSSVYHLAALESDRGVFTPRGFTVTADSAIIAKMNTWLSVLAECGIDWIRPGGSGADVGRIKGAKALIGFAPDNQRYMDLHHSENDVLEAVHPREMELGSAAIAIMALLLSDLGL